MSATKRPQPMKEIIMRNRRVDGMSRMTLVCLAILTGTCIVWQEASLGCPFCTSTNWTSTSSQLTWGSESSLTALLTGISSLSTCTVCEDPVSFEYGTASVNNCIATAGDNPYAAYEVKGLSYSSQDSMVRRVSSEAGGKDGTNCHAPLIMEICYGNPDSGKYKPENETMQTYSMVADNIPTATSADGTATETVVSGVVTGMSATKGTTWTYEDKGWNEGHTVHTTEYTESDEKHIQLSEMANYDNGQTQKEYPTQITVQRDDETISTTYYVHTINEDTLRLRVTVVTPSMDGGVIIRSTIYGYYPSSYSPSTCEGRLRYVVEPDGVARYIESNANNYSKGVDPGDPSATCGLDNAASDEDLMAFAARKYTGYYEDGRIAAMTGAGCGGCGSSSLDGAYEFYYDDEFDPDATGLNEVKTMRGAILPGGLVRRAQYLNKYGQIVYDLAYEMEVVSGQVTNNIVRVWGNHFIYHTTGMKKIGQVREHRTPAACKSADYTYTDSDNPKDGWIDTITPSDSGTGGLVRVYDYHLASGKLTAEKIRNGTQSGDEYWVRQYTYYLPAERGGYTLTRLHTVKEYTAQDSSAEGTGTGTTTT